MPIVSCFKKLTCLFITVEATIQPRLKNALSADQWTPVVGVLLLLCCFHEIYLNDLQGIGNTSQKKHAGWLYSREYIYIFTNFSEGTAFLLQGLTYNDEVTVNPLLRPPLKQAPPFQRRKVNKPHPPLHPYSSQTMFSRLRHPLPSPYYLSARFASRFFFSLTPIFSPFSPKAEPGPRLKCVCPCDIVNSLYFPLKEVVVNRYYKRYVH